MPAKIYYDIDADQTLLQGKKIAVLGYGSQGHAHAQNLRDSGCDVRVGLYTGSKSWPKAEKDGMTVGTVAEVSKWADIIMILLPDTMQRDVYDNEVGPGLVPGKTIMFGHGFNIYYKQVGPPPFVDVSMIAPKAPGHRVREVFVEGSGVPMLLAVEQNPSGKAKELALAYARAIGGTRAGVLETTFKEETETDLFGEQTLLVGGVTSLVKAGYETLAEAGYQPEVAYFETLHELKLIVDLMYQGGMNYMHYSVSDTAEYGGYTRAPRIITDETRLEMKKILKEIQDGTFAHEWITEWREGAENFNAMRRRDHDHPVEKIGAELRSMMTWLQKPKDSGAY